MDDHDDFEQGDGLLPALGRYRLIRRLALGGMAEIYLARAEGAEGFAKPVVIKRILPDQAQHPENVALFVEEARLAARLNHANITQIFDFAEDAQGGYYMAMEYVHGRDLREVLDRCRQLDRRPGLGRSAWVCAQVLEGLSYAHEFTRRGRPLEIVHRDISPRNILIGLNGDVKLADFGIARARGGIEEPNVVRGKLLYMSPEQICGAALDQRSDLYSLGLVLYEMLTGVRALEGPDGKGNAGCTARAEFPPAESLRPDLPRPLCAILDRALRRDPGERFADGREFLRELKQFLFSALLNPAEIELREFMSSIFPEVTDLTITVSSARALLIQRESSGLELTDALRRALARKAQQPAGEEEPPGAAPPPVPVPSAPSTTLPDLAGSGRGQGAAPAPRAAMVVAVAGTMVLTALVLFLALRFSGPGSAPEPAAPAAAPARPATSLPRVAATPPPPPALAVPLEPSPPPPLPPARHGPKARPGPAAPAAAEASCTLDVNADPYAEVWLDGHGPPRDTPAHWQLPPGKHSLRLVNQAEGVERREEITLAPGEHLQRRYELRK